MVDGWRPNGADLLGQDIRVPILDEPEHVAELERYRARGYAMKDNRIAIRTDLANVVDVHPQSLGMIDLSGLVVPPPRPIPGI